MRTMHCRDCGYEWPGEKLRVSDYFCRKCGGINVTAMMRVGELPDDVVEAIKNARSAQEG